MATEISAIRDWELPQLESEIEIIAEQPAPISILIVDDEDSARELCRDVVLECGFHARMASTTEQALEALDDHPVDILLTDLRVPNLGGLELLKRVRKLYPQVGVLVLTQYGAIETAVDATRLGAEDYLTKPFHVADLRNRLQRVVRSREAVRENRVLREQLRSHPGFAGLIGASAKMNSIYRLVERVSEHSYPVLILGESGTGKELLARSIHFSGSRRNRPFVPVDCTGLVPTLVEAELFGYVKGAFTGATHSKHGLIEAANGGTLFLDEIGDLPIDMQAKLLRALQEKEIRPVGSTERVPITIRVIAATNLDLEKAVRTGAFRQDLFFRLNVVQLKLPPLRERKTDIPILVNHFLEKFSERHGLGREISSDAMAQLLAYDWPGNIRELENAIERALALSSGPLLHVADLPSSLQYFVGDRLPASDVVIPLEELERRAILQALHEAHGDKLAAAHRLGIGKTTLYRKLKQYEGLARPT
jgi:two-component system response regulator HydG